MCTSRVNCIVAVQVQIEVPLNIGLVEVHLCVRVSVHQKLVNVAGNDAVQRLINGDDTARINLRQGDFLKEMADDFNELMDKRNK